MSQRRLTVAIAGLALVGLGISGYLTWLHYAGLNPLCVTGQGCETVQKSSYAMLAGVPVAVLGVAGYLGILGSLLVRGELGRLAGAGLALVGFGFSLYLTYLELFVIHAICQWCVASAVVMTVLVVLTVVRLLGASPEDVEPGAGSDDPSEPATPPSGHLAGARVR